MWGKPTLFHWANSFEKKKNIEKISILSKNIEKKKKKNEKR